MKTTLFVGKSPLQFNAVHIEGRPIDLQGESFYQIDNYDRMRPFFLSIVSGADHWMFISSPGGLTAGAATPISRSFHTTRMIKSMTRPKSPAAKPCLSLRNKAGTIFGNRSRSVTGEFTGSSATSTRVFGAIS